MQEKELWINNQGSLLIKIKIWIQMAMKRCVVIWNKGFYIAKKKGGGWSISVGVPGYVNPPLVRGTHCAMRRLSMAIDSL